MRKPKPRTLSALCTAVVVVAGVGVGLVPTLHDAAAGETTVSDLAAATRALDAMGGSGSAGIDPAAADAATDAEQAELTGDITFSVPSGTFQGQMSVQLSTAISGAQIRYTTNGTLPTTSSTLYSSAVTLTATTQLRAQAFVDGTATGAPGTAVYIARAVTTTHDLPLVVMDAYGKGKPNKTDYRDVATMIIEPKSGSASLATAPAVATRAGFHLRGQSSSNFEKAPYRLELWDNEGKDADYPLLGMPADSDWVLRGPFPDKTLIRDAFAYGLGREMGLKAPRFAFVELYLNLDAQPMAANDYQGVYLLVETIKRSDDRLDIAKLKKTDVAEPAVSGGYIMQFNMGAAEPPTIPCSGTSCWRDLELMEPDEPQPEQLTWITNYVQRFHNALRSSNPSNEQTGYPAYIDVDSFVNRIIHNELAREGDSYMRSTHFFKDRDGKLTAGPLWDYDLGYEAFTGFGGFGGTSSTVQGWQYQPMGGFGMAQTTDWFSRLMADQAFLNKVKARWQSLRGGAMSDAQLTARVNAIALPLANAAKRNFQRWPNLSTSQVGGFGTQVTQSWDEQLQIMRNFLTQRAAWLSQSANWGGAVTTTPPTSSSSSSSQPTSSSSQSQTGKGCAAQYTITSQWNTGFQADIKVTAGTSAITGWTVSFTFANGQAVTQSWNTTMTSSGSSVTAKNVSHNGSLSAGASTTFGFVGTWSGTNAVPSVSCTAS